MSMGVYGFARDKARMVRNAPLYLRSHLRNRAVRARACRSRRVPSLVGDDKESWEKAFFFFLGSILGRMDERTGRFRVKRGFMSTNGPQSDSMEALARSMLSFSLFLHGKRAIDVRRDKKLTRYVETYRKVMLEGMDPDNRNYWGKVRHCQILAENGSIAAALLLSREHFLAGLSPGEKRIMVSWFKSHLDWSYQKTNWQWFKLFHALVLEELGVKVRKSVFDDCMKVLDSIYLGEGWYTDGRIDGMANLDYYNAWGMHFFGLLFVLLAGKKHYRHVKVHRKRAEEFLKWYSDWFSPGSAPPPYGRSHIYRFASVCLTGLAVEARVKVDQALLKKCSIDTINKFLSAPIVDEDGVLTMGYFEERPSLSDRYNGFGSPYWALIGFSPLMLKDDHVFWKLSTKGVRPLRKTSACKAAASLAVHDGKGQVLLLNGLSTRNDHPSRYNKFAYSNTFLPDIGDESCSNCLSFKDEGDKGGWCYKRIILSSSVKGGVVVIRWKPLVDGVEVETVLKPINDGYRCVNKIRVAGGRDVLARLGGFSISSDHDKFRISNINKSISAYSRRDKSSIALIRQSSSTDLRLGVQEGLDKNLGPRHSRTPFAELRVSAGPDAVLGADITCSRR